MISFEQPIDYLLRRRDLDPSGAMLIEYSNGTTVEQFVDTARRLATILRERGVRRGQIVSIDLPGTLAFIAVFAVFHEAAVSVTHSQHPFDIGLDWVITQTLVDGFSPERQIVVTEDTIARLSEEQPVNEPVRYSSGDDVLRIGFSSGTTGLPKAIPFTVAEQAQRSLDNHSHWQSETGFLSLLAPLKGPGWHSWYASMMLGKHHFVPNYPDHNADMIKRFAIDSVAGSPLQLDALARFAIDANITFPDVRVVMAGGAALPRNVLANLRQVTDARIGTFYGLSEVGRISMKLDSTDDASDVGTLVSPLEIEVFNADTNETLPNGTVGNLRFRKPGMVHEYRGNAEATAKHFRDGWFLSNDRGYLEGNRLFLRGRDSDVVNIGGAKYHLAGIDLAYDQYFEIRDCAAFSFVDISGTTLVGLAVVPTRPIDVEEFASRARDELGIFTPRAIVEVAEIPRNEMGKPLRRELSDRFQSIFDKTSERNPA